MIFEEFYERLKVCAGERQMCDCQSRTNSISYSSLVEDTQDSIHILLFYFYDCGAFIHLQRSSNASTNQEEEVG